MKVQCSETIHFRSNMNGVKSGNRRVNQQWTEPVLAADGVVLE